jgi:LPS sulfotransferase NodH
VENKSTFLLVSGTMRSGTTLLGEMLDSGVYPDIQRHPDIIFHNEKIMEIRKLQNLHFKEKGLISTSTKLDIGIVQKVFEKSVDETRGSADVIMHRMLKRKICKGENPQVYGAKFTNLFAEMCLFEGASIDTKMVLLVRNPLDVLCSSMVRQGLVSDRATYMSILVQVLSNYYFHLANKDNPQILTIKYEDLVSKHKATLGSVLDFINVDKDKYNWDSLNTHLATNSSFVVERGKGYAPTKGISPKITHRYGYYLSPMEIDFCIWLCKPVFEHFGYEAPDSGKLSDGNKKAILDKLIATSKKLGYSNEAVIRRLKG